MLLGRNRIGRIISSDARNWRQAEWREDHLNILFLMVDQLRFDYLGCAGHPTIRTPNIDALARRGVRFDRTYVQSPICGPSRMSFYTGRYVRSHGATWNNVPLRAGEMTLGDHLRPLGMDAVLCGKTHMTPDLEGLERLGIDPESRVGRRIAECGFDVWERHDGEFPEAMDNAPSSYQDYLRSNGYEAANPWHEWANSGEGKDGSLLSGWLLKYASEPARVPNEHSETAWTHYPRHRFHRAGKQQSMVSSCQLHQAPLAVYCAGTL